MTNNASRNGSKPVRERPERSTVGLIVNAFTDKVGNVVEVTTGAHLGNDTLEKVGNEYVGFSHFRQDSKVPVSFTIDSLGEPSQVEAPAPGLREVDVEFDALSYLDEQEKLDALTDKEKHELEHIGVMQLREIANEAHTDDLPGWTAKQDAAIAILQHEDVPTTKWVHNTRLVDGPVVGSVVTLMVGTKPFSPISNTYNGCDHKHCRDGRELWQYSWTGVDRRVLDEPRQ